SLRIAVRVPRVARDGSRLRPCAAVAPQAWRLALLAQRGRRTRIDECASRLASRAGRRRSGTGGGPRGGRGPDAADRDEPAERRSRVRSIPPRDVRARPAACSLREVRRSVAVLPAAL